MPDYERVSKMTVSLSELFPEKRNELDKERWYYEHQYTTFKEWEEAVERIIDSVA